MLHLVKESDRAEIELSMRIVGAVAPDDITPSDDSLMCTCFDHRWYGNMCRERIVLTDGVDGPPPFPVPEELWRRRYNRLPGWRSLLQNGWRIVSEDAWRGFIDFKEKRAPVEQSR